MRAVWLALIAVAACKGKKKSETDEFQPSKQPPGGAIEDDDPPPAKKKQALPEAGPHPDYPTAAAAGTDKIFFLEEPDRGPKAPAAFKRPANLAWTRAAYCEPYEKTFACSPGAGDWYIGKAKGVTLLERRRGAIVDEATAYVADADGKITQRLALDRENQVTQALLFTQPGRYTGRDRGGGNALEGCGMYAYTEDAQGRVTESRCLQWLGDPMRDTSGVAIRKYELDAHGFNKGWTNYGIDGAPVDDTTGVNRAVYTRDAAGRVVTKQWYGKDKAPVMTTAGCAGARLKYDDAGRLASQTCLDATDQPVGDHDGVAETTYGHDDKGCEMSRRFFDKGGRRVTNAYGVHGRDYVADARCDVTTETCIGSDYKPRACSPGESARRTFARDARGRVISTKHFEASGEEGQNPSYRVFELRYTYDDADHSTGMTCHGGDGSPLECSATGFHGWRAEFDDAGRMTSQSFVDTRGRPATNLGTFKRVYRYDNYDHEYEARSFDRAGAVIEVSGMAIRRNLWDATHRLFAIQLYDANEKPARYGNCYVGATCPGKDKPWHAVRIDRRPDGTALSNRFFDADGQLIDTVDCRAKPCFGN